MKTRIMKLAGSAALALLLTACGGGGGTGTTGSTTGASSGQANSLPQPMQAVVDQSDNFTQAFCPNTVAGASTGTAIDPVACFKEAVAGLNTSNLPSVIQSFCPTAVSALGSGGSGSGSASGSGGGTFSPQTFNASFSNSEGFRTSGSLTFPAACLEEAATNLHQIQSLTGTNNPITQQLCPNAASAATFDPQTCFSEIASGASGGLPGLPNGSGLGSLGGSGFLNQFCPQTASQGLSPQTPIECLTEASGMFSPISGLLTSSNPLYGTLCPNQSASSPDPVACFQNALTGAGGLPVSSGALSSGAQQLLDTICPNTASQAIGANTPVNCLTEAGQKLGGLQNLLGALGNNPLTQNLCPNAAAAGTFSPQACFTEALSNLGSAGGGSLPSGLSLSQICPNAASSSFNPTTTPTACLMELGGNFGNLQNVLGNLGGSNPLTQALCPTAAASGSFDPAACFTEALQNLPGGMALPGGSSGENLPIIGTIMAQFCPNTAQSSVGLTTPAQCLQEAGQNLGNMQNVLGGLTGANPLTNALCPNASSSGTVDPQACLTEALGTLTGGNAGSVPGLSTLLDQFCPNTASSGVSASTPIQCLSEAGGKLGQLQNLLGGLGGSGASLSNNPLTQNLCPTAAASSSFSPQACLTEALGQLPSSGSGNPLSNAICPNTVAAGINAGTPLNCLVEAGGNLVGAEQMLGNMSLSNNALTQNLCPNAAGSASFTPQACLNEAFGSPNDLPGLSALRGLLSSLVAGASGSLTPYLCPTEATATSFNPVTCMSEAASDGYNSLGNLLTFVGSLL